MATVKTPLIRKLEKVLVERFPSPDTVKLDYVDGVIGVITSRKFLKMDGLDRQNLIDDIVESHLSPDEQRRVKIIVGVTPDEGTGYLAWVE